MKIPSIPISTIIVTLVPVLVLTVLAVYSIDLVRTELTSLRVSADQELRVVGQTLVHALENAMRDNQHEDVEEAVRALDLPSRNLDALLFDESGRWVPMPFADTTRRPSLTQTELDALIYATITTEQTHVWTTTGATGSVMMAAFPFERELDRMMGGVVIVRPLDDLERTASRTRNRGILMALTVIAAVLSVGIWAGQSLIRKPARRLVEAIRVLGSGRLDMSVPVFRDDELGEIARVFNETLDQLRAERTRADQADLRHLEAESMLRRAQQVTAMNLLLSGLAHELGTPLQVIAGRASNLARSDGMDETTRRSCEQIAEQAARMTRTLSVALNATRARSHQDGVCDPRQAVEGIVEFLQLSAESQGVRLECESDPRLPLAAISSDAMQQIVLNLLSNALKASRSGGCVRVQLAGVTNDEGLPRIRLRVEDAGVGMNIEQRERAFEPFFTRSPDDRGTGLGLPIVQRLVRECHGELSLESRENEGTQVQVEIPVHQPRSAPVLEHHHGVNDD
jgi:two-component system NtrC family sensor kinase